MQNEKVVSTNSSVESAFALLKLFAGATEPIGLSDMARQLELPLSTTHRVVSSLCTGEFLTQPYAGGPYSPGLRVRELLNALYNRYPIRRHSMKALRSLSDASGQAAALYVLFGTHSLRIAGAQDRQQVHRPLLIGETRPLASSPSGRVILAHRPHPTDSHATMAPDEHAETADIRARGYLATAADALRSVTFPLVGANGEAFAAVAVEGATLEFSEPTARQIRAWQEIVNQLQESCIAHPEWTILPFGEGATEGIELPAGGGNHP